MVDICEETKEFVHACEALHTLLDNGDTLTSEERDLIEISGVDLLSKLRPVSVF